MDGASREAGFSLVKPENTCLPGEVFVGVNTEKKFVSEGKDEEPLNWPYVSPMLT